MVMTARHDISLITTTKIVLIVEYDGTDYHGFQWQANLPTVQGEIETALEKLTGERLRVAAASRTDAGVHAQGQVVSFRTKSHYSQQTFVDGLNYYLPQDIAVKTAHKAADSFNVRRHAIGREYNYCILNSLTRSPLKAPFTHRVEGHLDIEVMNQACQALIGEHDLASFASDFRDEIKSTVYGKGTRTIRRVYRAEFSRQESIQIPTEENLVLFNMVASSFLPHQVRNTVGALIRVGQDKMSVNEFYHIVKAKKTGLAGPTAPACGLCLTRVNYPHHFEQER
ncbi:MAG: tRNA pseudouridine(38-40) synthase TruA [Dehalococcoidales bacterium]|jgi:tRNA pseudouridine38-40 synthase|nr:tRNA pseudouridine(38-40) synthase TruA [Dehalococcoidales bacterium]|tara:strand:+ start:26 stop:874 length:849 start_codon:yes stop_codon:yes gene_type:complete